MPAALASVRRDMIASVLNADDARCADSHSHDKLLWSVDYAARGRVAARRRHIVGLTIPVMEHRALVKAEASQVRREMVAAVLSKDST